MNPRLVSLTGCAIVIAAPTLSSAPLPEPIQHLFNHHCYECHDEDVQKGDLDLTALPVDFKNPADFQQWIEILDRVEAGEMPPEKEPRPDPEVIQKFAAQISTPLDEAQLAIQAEFGRGRLRRLNRSEFETTLSDLLHHPFHIKEDLPEDARSHGFDTVGEALNVSSVQMDAYLSVLDTVLDQATTLYEKPAREKHRLTFRESSTLMQVYRKGGPYHIQDDGVALFATEKFSHFNSVIPQYTVPHSGIYKVSVSAYALRNEGPIVMTVRAGGTGHAESNHVPHVVLNHFSVSAHDPFVFEWEGWLERGHYFHVYPSSLRPMRFAGNNEYGKQKDYTGPALVMQWLEVDGPILKTWPPQSHKTLWSGIPTSPLPDAKPNRDYNEHLKKPPAQVAMPRMKTLTKAE